MAGSHPTACRKKDSAQHLAALTPLTRIVLHFLPGPCWPCPEVLFLDVSLSVIQNILHNTGRCRHWPSNHRAAGAGRDLCRSPSATPCRAGSRRDHPQKYSGPRPGCEGGRRGIFTHSGGGGAGSEAHRSSELQQRLAQGPAL